MLHGVQGAHTGRQHSSSTVAALPQTAHTTSGTNFILVTVAQSPAGHHAAAVLGMPAIVAACSFEELLQSIAGSFIQDRHHLLWWQCFVDHTTHRIVTEACVASLSFLLGIQYIAGKTQCAVTYGTATPVLCSPGDL